MEQSDTLWLENALDRAIRENWCTNRKCSTCGCPEMRSLLTGAAWVPGLDRLAFQELSEQRAKTVISGLAACTKPAHTPAIMWLLYEIWRQFRDHAHRSLFPELDGTLAGEILTQMRTHYG